MSDAPSDLMEYIDWLTQRMRADGDIEREPKGYWFAYFRHSSIRRMRLFSKAVQRAGYATIERPVTYEIVDAGKNKYKEVRALPFVQVLWYGKSTALAVKRKIRPLLAIAQEHGAEYRSLDCYDQESFDLFYGPPRAMSIDDAAWRLMHYSDNGLKAGAEIKYSFCLATKDIRACRAALRRRGFADLDRAPEGADWQLTVNVAGTNNQKKIRAAYANFEPIAKEVGARLKGLQL